MFAICDLVVTNGSHESPNSGFLASVLELYGNDTILLYGERDHIHVIKNRVVSHGFDDSNLIMRPLFHVSQSAAPIGFMCAFWVCLKMLFELKKNGCDTLLVLGCQPAHFYILKFLLSLNFFSRINIVFILHGYLEELAKTSGEITQLIPFDTPPASQPCWWRKFAALSWKDIFIKTLRIAGRKVKQFYSRFQGWHPILFHFSVTGSLLYKKSHRFRYIVLSDHILTRLRKYVDLDSLGISSITMPSLFSTPPHLPNNDHAKFAIFGFGNSGMLQRLNMALASMDIQNDYEIRIVGMDGRGIEPYPNVTQPVKGFLAREQMEELIQDVDMFLILYEDFRYKLSCSASIIEAHCYAKPILYLANECIDFFNPPHCPIGISCRDAESMAEEIQKIVNNYQESKNNLHQYYDNILIRRQEIDIMNSLPKLKQVLTFTEQ